MKIAGISLVAATAATAATAVAPAPAQQQDPRCPPGSSGNPYCEVPPPNACRKLPAKMSIARATLTRAPNRTSIFAPLTHLASGRAPIRLQAAGTTTRFNAPVASGRIRATRPITAAQANLATGILTIDYLGDPDTRPQTVRLRAANNPAALTSSRPIITSTGRLRAAGTTTRRASGVVRVQLQYVRRSNGQTVTLQRNARIRNGRWNLNVALPASVRAQIPARCGTVHSYVLFTGYYPNRIRGEMHSVTPAGAGNDQIDGGAGDDTLVGLAGRDKLTGGSGDDTINASDGEKDTIVCGSGEDTVDADALDVVAKDCETVV